MCTAPVKQTIDKRPPVEQSRKTGQKDKVFLGILAFKLYWAKPAKRGMNSLCVVVKFNISEYVLPSLFRILVMSILNKLSF